jgi:glyoxylase-like metal-dependent hydrolase (beta-lactamase superfamily II)
MGNSLIGLLSNLAGWNQIFGHPERPMVRESIGKISDRLYAIGNPGLPAFLLLGEIPVLFEAGMTFMGPAYLKQLKTYLGDAGHLRYLLLTHSHYDHCGAAPFLQRSIPGLKIGASRLAAEVFKRPNAVRLIQSLSRDPEERFKPLMGDADVTFHSLEIDLLLAHGDELVLGDGDRVQVIATPGHTRDAVSFYIRGMKALIPGEAVGAYDRNFSIQPEFLSSYEDYRTSLEKLTALDIQILLLAHSYLLMGEEARGYMAKSIEATSRFKTRIENLLDTMGGDQEAVVKRIFKEDYEDTQAIPHDEMPFLINLKAKVKAVSERK